MVFVSALNIMQKAVETAASTTRELAKLRERAQSLTSPDHSIIDHIESLLRNGGFGPLEQNVHIARSALDMLMKRK